MHQPLYTTPVTAALSLLACLYHVTVTPMAKRTSFADVLVLNGPGTCFVLCLAVFINRVRLTKDLPEIMVDMSLAHSPLDSGSSFPDTGLCRVLRPSALAISVREAPAALRRQVLAGFS